MNGSSKADMKVIGECPQCKGEVYEGLSHQCSTAIQPEVLKINVTEKTTIHDKLA